MLASLFIGCGGDVEPTVPGPATKGGTPATSPPDAPPKATEEAARAATIALDAVREGHPDVLWDRLPESYRGDVTGLVRGFAEKVPAATWDETVAAVRRSAEVMHDRRAWFLSHPLLARKVLDEETRIDPATALRENWDGVVALIRTLSESDLADREQVRKLEIGPFLASTGRETVGQLFDLAGEEVTKTFRNDLAAMEVTPVKEVGDAATIRIGGAGFEEIEHGFRRVGDRWIPVTLADAWDDAVSAAAQRIDAWSFDAPAQRAWSERVAAWTGTLDDLGKAESEAAFHARLDEAIALLTPAGATPPDPTPTAEGTVVVVFAGRLDLATVDKVQVLLNAAAADPDLAVSIDTIEGDTTRFEVSHAGPIAGYVDRLKANSGVEVQSVDAENGRVDAKWQAGEEEDE